eukprot:CAMPEP_0172930112 /NCGR_PEP_ID=MMETSP1075-20121228/218827_1 /TAXON_ID=2916 /ORGANISM="Ceratium fusus, Strain PA161109" /LENGTH=536 /DNA_ID=CAMNT_0013791421 /DNA_START=93 /DNA_END=1700 /DNA_ORIENTATION=-
MASERGVDAEDAERLQDTYDNILGLAAAGVVTGPVSENELADGLSRVGLRPSSPRELAAFRRTLESACKGAAPSFSEFLQIIQQTRSRQQGSRDNRASLRPSVSQDSSPPPYAPRDRTSLRPSVSQDSPPPVYAPRDSRTSLRPSVSQDSLPPAYAPRDSRASLRQSVYQDSPPPLYATSRPSRNLWEPGNGTVVDSPSPSDASMQRPSWRSTVPGEDDPALLHQTPAWRNSQLVSTRSSLPVGVGLGLGAATTEDASESVLRQDRGRRKSRRSSSPRSLASRRTWHGEHGEDGSLTTTAAELEQLQQVQQVQQVQQQQQQQQQQPNRRSTRFSQLGGSRTSDRPSLQQLIEGDGPVRGWTRLTAMADLKALLEQALERTAQLLDIIPAGACHKICREVEILIDDARQLAREAVLLPPQSAVKAARTLQGFDDAYVEVDPRARAFAWFRVSAVKSTEERRRLVLAERLAAAFAMHAFADVNAAVVAVLATAHCEPRRLRYHLMQVVQMRKQQSSFLENHTHGLFHRKFRGCDVTQA